MTAIILLLILGGSVALLPDTERGPGGLAAVAAVMAADILAFTEAGVAMAPDTWLFLIAIALVVLNQMVRAGNKPDAQEYGSEVR